MTEEIYINMDLYIFIYIYVYTYIYIQYIYIYTYIYIHIYIQYIYIYILFMSGRTVDVSEHSPRDRRLPGSDLQKGFYTNTVGPMNPGIRSK